MVASPDLPVQQPVPLRRHLMVLALFAILLFAVVMQVDRFDSGELSRTSSLLDTIIRHDIAVDREMMALFTHRKHDTSHLVELSRALHDSARRLMDALQEDLHETAEGLFADPENSELMRRQMMNLEQAVTRQEQAVRRFLNEIPRLTDAQRTFPQMVEEMVVRSPRNAVAVAELASDLNRWQLFPEEGLGREVARRIERLGKEARLHSLLATASALLDAHAAVRAAIDTAEKSGIVASLSQLRGSYERHYADETRVHTIGKRILAGMVIALLLYLVVLLIASGKRNAFLQGVLDERSALQEDNRLLLAAMHSAPNGMLVCDREGRVLYANDALADIHGEDDPQRLVGRYAAELRGGEKDDSLYKEMMAAIERGDEWHGDYTLEDEKGRSTIFRTMSGISLDGHDYLVGIDRDVTDERARAAKLEAIQRLESLGVLAGGIAHDFNNILTAIQGNVVLAMRNCDEKVAQYLRRVEEGARRAADLCQQMLAYAGKGQFIVEPLDLSELVRGLSQLISVSIDKRITLVEELAPDLPPVEGDRAQLQQIVLNLITNASEAITGQEQFTDGKITVTTCCMDVDAAELEGAVCGSGIEPGRFVVLEVRDNGCGMDEATRQRLFEPFFTTKFTGRGLGMSAILGIVQGHNGALLLESEAGKGSCFRILFPPTDKPVPTGSYTPDGDSVADDHGGTVLVIDDEAVIREIAEEVLQDCGLETFSAEDGVAGVALFREHRDEIDAVLLDMTMPNMDGEQCFRALREIRPDLPVVVASGYSEQDVVQAFGEGNLAGFIHKPFDPEHLQRMMVQTVRAGRRT